MGLAVQRTAVGLAMACMAGVVVAANDAMWEALRDGGTVLLMRHAVTETTNDPLHQDPYDCRRERNLSETGRAQARRLGQELRQRKVAVAAVLASPYCRTRETAELAFGKATSWEALSLIEGQPGKVAAARSDEVMKHIGAFKGPGNLVLVTHQPNIEHVALESAGFSEVLVLRSDGNGGFDVIGRLLPP